MFCICQRKSLHLSQSINVPNIWSEQDQLASCSAWMKTLNCCALMWCFHIPVSDKSKYLSGAPGPRFPSLSTEVLRGYADNHRHKHRQRSHFSEQQKEVVSELCLWLLTSLEKHGVSPGLLKWWEKMSGGAFPAYCKLLTSLLSASCRAAEVCCSWWDQTYRVKLTEGNF